MRLNNLANRGSKIMAYCKNCGNELPKGAKYCPKCGTAVVEAVPTLTLALWGERFVAWLIDVVIIGAILGIIWLVCSIVWPTFTGWPSFPTWIPFFSLGVDSIVYFVYCMFMDGTYGQSFGKMVMRIRVVQLDGSRIGMTHAVLESVGKAFLLPIDFIIGLILYAKKRQRIFNYISETLVVKS